MTDKETSFDLRAYSEGWQEHRKEWSRDESNPRFRRMIPTPGAYFCGVVGRGNIDAFAQGLGLGTGELLAQLNAGTVREDHWPAILKAEKEGLLDQPASAAPGPLSSTF
jgi:hypothetical protein